MGLPILRLQVPCQRKSSQEDLFRPKIPLATSKLTLSLTFSTIAKDLLDTVRRKSESLWHSVRMTDIGQINRLASLWEDPVGFETLNALFKNVC